VENSTNEKTNTLRYHDGNDEDWLYEKIVIEGRRDYEQLMKENTSWVVKYHLSPQRSHLLLPFEIHGEVLEVGAGCGGITEGLLKKADRVTSIELSTRRLSILKSRFKDATNLEIQSIPFHDFKTGKKYDCIIVVGVWEYSGKYFQTDSPYYDFIKYCYELLKPEGKLYLAIENKLGIKYLSGCPEDHYGNIFEGIEDYINDNGIRTFSKYEITELFKEIGFKSNEFYYPKPDYKLPKEIHTGWSFKNMDLVSNGTFPTSDPAYNRENVYSESMLFKTLNKANLSEEFANSFLIVGSKSKQENGSEILYSRLVTEKLPAFRYNTRILRKDGKLYVEKIKCHDEPNPFNKNAADVKSKLSAVFKFPKRDKELIEYIEGVGINEILFDNLLSEDLNSFKNTIYQLESRLLEVFPNGKLPVMIDLNFKNLKVKGKHVYIVDLEVIHTDPASIKVVLTRSLL
jgi:SAM-dependent methyltransferase